MSHRNEHLQMTKFNAAFNPLMLTQRGSNEKREGKLILTAQSKRRITPQDFTGIIESLR